MKRTYTWEPNAETVLHEPTVRAASVALARYGCDGATGRLQGDPVFEEITEGRQASWMVNGKKRSYSGCGDLIHWVLWRLMGADPYTGDSPEAKRARAELKRWMNRAEAYGWKTGFNIAKLRWKCGAWRSFKKGEFDPQPGDCLLIGEGGREHVAIFEGRDGDTYTSLDYGQFFNGKHGGKLCTRRIARGGDGRIHVGNARLRPVIGVVDVWKAAILVHPTFAALVPDTFDGGVPSDNPHDPEDP